MPYRQRFTLIINELGAAVAGRSGDLQAALRRAVPALTQTDNLLNLLANDSQTLKQLTTSSNSVITELANNSTQVERFITRGRQHCARHGHAVAEPALLAPAVPRIPRAAPSGDGQARRGDGRQHAGARQPQ